MNRGAVRDMSGEVVSEGAKVSVALGCRAVAQAVVQYGLESVVMFARKVGRAVDHNARDALSGGGALDKSLAVVDSETFFKRNRADIRASNACDRRASASPPENVRSSA